MEHILITGANGLIGQELLKRFASHYALYALVRCIPEKRVVNVQYILCDFATAWDPDILPRDISAIVHLAQSEKFREFPGSAVEVFNVNTYSTVKLLDYAKRAGIKKFIYASSGGIYGNSEAGFKEDFEISVNKDLGHYLTTKLISELLVETYSSFFDVLILRFFFVYGKQQRRSMLVPRLVDNVKMGREIILQGADGIKINPIHVSDAAMSIGKAIDKKVVGKYNIAGSEVFSIRELVEIIAKKVGRQPIYALQDAEPKNLIGDTGKMAKALHQPLVSFSEGIDELINENSIMKPTDHA